MEGLGSISAVSVCSCLGADGGYGSAPGWMATIVRVLVRVQAIRAPLTPPAREVKRALARGAAWLRPEEQQMLPQSPHHSAGTAACVRR